MFPTCLFKSITDLNCPFCGFTRSILSLKDLDLVNFFYYNLISPLLIYVFLLIIFKKKVRYHKILLALIIMFGIIRNTGIYAYY